MGTKYKGITSKIVLLCVFVIVGRVFGVEDVSPVYYSSDSLRLQFTEDGKAEEVIMDGNVNIVSEDVSIKCQKARLNQVTGEVEAEGDIVLHSDRADIKAKYLLYNLHSRTGVLTDGSFEAPPFYGKAKRIEKQGELYICKDGYLTTCDLEKPHYRMKCSTVEYLPNKYVRAEKIKFQFGEKLTLFYLPKGTYNLNWREPLFMLMPGYRTRLGTTLTVLYNRQFKYLDMIASTRFDINRKGVGLGTDIVSGKNKFRFSPFLLKEYNSSGIEKGVIGEFHKTKENRFGNLNAILDWRWMQNKHFFRDYFSADFDRKNRNYNYLSVSQTFPAGIANVLVRHNAQNEFLNIQKLPEISFYAPLYKIPSFPAYIKNDFRTTYFFKSGREYLRTLNCVTLETKKPVGALSVKPWISLTTAHYHNTEKDMFNLTKEFGVEMSALFQRTWGRNIREYFVPSLAVLYRGNNYKSSELPHFDPYDMLDNGTFVDLTLDWNFWKDNKWYGKVNFKNSYDVNKGRFADYFLKYEFDITKHVSIEGENIGNYSTGEYLFGVNDLILHIRKVTCSVGTRYVQEDVWGVESQFKHSIGRNWKYGIGLFYDFKKDSLIRQTYQIERVLHCWTVNFQIGKSENDFSFFFSAIPTAFTKGLLKRGFFKW